MASSPREPALQRGPAPGRLVRQAAAGRQLPPAPFAVAVVLAGNVPFIVSEFPTKTAAGFFSKHF